MKTTLSHHFLRISVALLTVFLASCAAVGPTYEPPRPDMPTGWSESTKDLQVAADADINTWWTLFKDPVLDSLIQRTIASNQDLRIAETRIREARAQRQLAGSAQVPALNASASSSHSRSYENTASGKGSRDLYQAGFDAGWEVDIFGGVRRSIEAADASVASSLEDKRDIQVSLLAEVARNYLELRGSQQRIAIANQNIANQEETVALVQRRFEIGLSSELELEQAKNQLYMSKSPVPGLETIAAQAMHRLALLIGQQPQALVAELSPEVMIPATPPEIPVALPSELLRRRPDIRRAERDLATATAQVGVATADLFPRFSLGAMAGLESTSLSDLVTSGSRFWSFGPTVKWALFDGGRARAGVEISNAQRDRAQIAYEKSVLAALADVEDALVAFNREQQTRRTLAAAADSAQRAATIARDQYKLGLIDFLNVLLSDSSLRQSQDQLVQSEQRLSMNMVALFKSLGGGWEVETPL
ncbi:MAG: efflux transporter outer membrane subunit [Desulfoprunum sp.]|nr:efflux transporter outer membrane subunit [Desulfoprunum sp.]